MHPRSEHRPGKFRPGRYGRGGFTLIELLVVIAIIGILVALTTAAVMRFLSKGPELQTTTELRQMTAAVDQFRAKFGFTPPSLLTLASNPTSMDANSQRYINRMFPRIDWSGGSGPIDWSGTGNPGPFTLQGDQCLVFFLGGIPEQSTPGCLGFSNIAKNPTSKNGERIRFYEFKPGKLIKRGGSPFYSYTDPWDNGKPYVYFSSGGRENGYRANGTDCDLIVNGAYYQAGASTKRFFNPKTCQIISAGVDGIYGNGGAWSTNDRTNLGVGGLDDQCNFHDRKMGD